MTATAPEAPVPGTGSVLLEARDITKRYQGISALSSVAMDVEVGDFVGLIGPNGAGKTTLFDCLLGKQRPDIGTVTFAGREIQGMAVHRRARLGIARTFQRMEPFSGLTVRDHLRVGYRAKPGGRPFWRELLTLGREDSAERARCDEVLELLGLGPDADRPIESLSLGRGRLVELAGALITDPRLLFLDEPSSGLDRGETEEMGDVLVQVQRESNVAIVLVEHDVPLVRRLVRRLYVLDSGVVIASGPTDEVLADPQVREAYLGREP